MNNIPFLQNIDRWLLLNYPRIWATRVHYLLAFFVIGGILASILAFFTNTDPTLELLEYNRTGSILGRLWESQLYLGMFSVVILIFWLYQFRAELRVFTFVEGFLSILFTAFITFAFLFFISSYKIVLEKRQANLYTPQDTRRDITILTQLNILMQDDTRFNTIENLNIDGYAFSKDEAVHIRSNIDNFDKLRALGTRIDDIDVSKFKSTTQEDIQQEKNLWFQYYHFKAVEESHIVPDSIKAIYLAISKDNDNAVYEIPDTIEAALKIYYDRKKPSLVDFLGVQMPKISSTYQYLCKKYKREDVSGLTTDLNQQYIFQRSNLLQHCTSERYFYDENPTINRTQNPDGTYTSFYDFSQKNVDTIYEQFKEGEQKSTFWRSWNMVLALLAVPFFILLFWLNFTLRDILLALIAFGLLALFHTILLKGAVDYEYGIYFFVINIILWTISAYLYFAKEVSIQKFAKLFIPLSILISMVTMPIVGSAIISNYTDAHRLDSFTNPIDYGYLYAFAFNLWECYVFFIVPFLIVLYHRLVLSPAKN